MQSARDAQLARSRQRWYPLRPHPVQVSLVTDNIRFKVVLAGRRSGKTERFKRYLVQQAMMTPDGLFFVAAPTAPQCMSIYWKDLKLLSMMPDDLINKTERTISFYNGASIQLIGLDEPERIEGPAWDGGGVDEIASCKSDAWESSISPALDTNQPTRPDYRPWVWIIGKPKGKPHHRKLVEKGRFGGPDWKLYHWKSEEILPPDMIAAAKARTDPRAYRIEYEASDELLTGAVYYNYGDHNRTHETLQPHESIWWCHDFNFSPLSSAICTRRGDAIYILGEIVLQSAVARQSALEFCDRFAAHGNRSVVVYGDPAGRAGEKHGHQSDYTELEQVLRQHGWQVERRVKAKAPAIKDRHNAVCGKLKTEDGTVSLFVNRDLAPYCHEGLRSVQLKEGSTFQEEISETQHITTAIGYMVEYEWPVRPEKPKTSNIVRPTVHHWRRPTPFVQRWR